MLIFLDLETTGLQKSDKIVSIAIIAKDGDMVFSKYEVVNEGKKISSYASSINNITNEMIKDKAPFVLSESFLFLQKYNLEDSIIVAHNSKFDLSMLLLSGINWRGKTIDTLRCTKHLISECEFFSLAYLRYELKLYRDEEEQKKLYFDEQESLVAHSAMLDAVVAKLLYEYLLEIKPQEELLLLTHKNAVVEKLTFGKYRGRYIEEISMCDISYLEWIIANISDLDEDLRYSIERFLKGKT